MQPTSQTTPELPALPTDFFAQAWARFFKRPMPKFFQILIAVFGSAGTILGLALYYQNDLISKGQVSPEWLDAIITALRAFLYLSGVLTARLTIQTASTPPLSLDKPEPTVKELAARLAQLEARPTVQQPYIYTTPPNETKTVITQTVLPAGLPDGEQTPEPTYKA